MPTSRRRFVRTVGIGGTIALAGCTGNGNGNGNGNGDGNGNSTPSTTGNSGKDPLNLVHHSVLPNDTVYTDPIKVFAEEVNTYTDREITFEYHFGGELAGAGQATQMLNDDVADTAAVPPAYDASRYPLSSFAQLPGLYSDPLNAAAAFQELVNNELAEVELESAGIKAFAVGVTPTYGIATSDERITQPADCEGKVLRSYSPVVSRTINALGGSAENIPYSEVVQALNRGTIDGGILQPNQYYTIPGGHEPLNYHTTNISAGGSSTYFATSLQTWENFPSDVQEAFRQAAPALNESWASGIAGRDGDAMEEFGDDVDFYEIESSAQDEFRSIFDSVRESWAERQQSTEDAQTLLDAFASYLD